MKKGMKQYSRVFAKRGLYAAILMLPTLLLSSCAREDFDWLIGTPINVTATAESVTRSGANIQTTNFEAGQTINAYYKITGGDVIGNSPTTLTAGAPVSGKNTLTPDVQPYYPSTGTVDIYALYPPTKATATTTSFSVEANQIAPEDYKLSDLMWASVYNQAKTTNDVNLTFSHKMAKIAISVTGQEGVTIKSIKLINTVREIAVDNIALSTRALGTLASPSNAAEKQIIVATSSTTAGDEVLSGAALFPGQTIEADFIEVETNYGTTIFSAGNKTFIGGTEYTANLIITRQMIGFTATITDWTADNGTIAVPPGSSAGLYISNIPVKTYTGSAIEPALNIVYSMNSVDYPLEEGVDYELQFFNNVNQGTATIIINGKADPAKIGSGTTGTVEAASAIAKIRAIKNFNIEAATGNLSYPNNDGKVTVEYQYNAQVNNLLDKHGGDGTITYESTVPTVAKVSESGVVTIVGAGTTFIKAHMANDGNYSADDAQYELEVTPRSLKNNYNTNNTGVVKISLPVSSFTYTGQAYRPMVTVTDNGRTLLEGTHFTYTVTDNVNAGTNTGTVVISGKNNYSNAENDRVTLHFTINKADPNLQLDNSTVKLAKGHSYTRRATAAYGANNITWSSSPAGYVTIDGGVVTAIQPTSALSGNKVTITATVLADANGNWDAQSKTYDLTVVESSWEFTNPTNASDKRIQSWTCPLSGYYELEAMGARGGSVTGDNGSYEGGKGADIAGQVYITEGQVLYIYLGQAGTLQGTSEIFNGGGYCTTSGNSETLRLTSGGGATDFALKSATWSSTDHLYTRILVAGGGGGGLYYYSGTTPRMRSGDGGGGGGNADTYKNEAGTGTITNRGKYVGQSGLGGSHPGGGGTLSGGGALTSPGTNGNAGSFGKGGNYSGSASGGAGGGGWYGGASGSQVTNFGSGGGGSSFMFNSANVTAAGNVNGTGKNYRTLLNNNLPTSGNYFNPSTLEISETTLVMGGAPNTASNPHGQARITYMSAE